MSFSPFSLFRKRALEAQLPTGVTLTPRTAAPVAPQPPDLSEVEALTAKISSLTAERDQALSANVEIGAKLEALTGELSAVKLERDTAASERDAAKSLAAKTREEVAAEVRQIELASLAASQGIPAAEIVPAAGPGEKTDDEKIQELSERLSACTSPTERFLISKEVRALISNKKTN